MLKIGYRFMAIWSYFFIEKAKIEKTQRNITESRSHCKEGTL